MLVNGERSYFIGVMPREKKPKVMQVEVEVGFWIPFNQVHVDAMTSLAKRFSCEPSSVNVYPRGKRLIASFVMLKELEANAADRLLRNFRVFIPESGMFTIWFPKPRRIRKSRRKIPSPAA